jgi:hypothetical protein
MNSEVVGYEKQSQMMSSFSYLCAQEGTRKIVVRLEKAKHIDLTLTEHDRDVLLQTPFSGILNLSVSFAGKDGLALCEHTCGTGA